MREWRVNCALGMALSEIQTGADSSGLTELLGMQTRLGMPRVVVGGSKFPFSLEQEWLQEGRGIAVHFPGKR